jgi:hypothetical protein
MGVPVADAAGITGTGTLGLTGATAGQFRVLGKWPSGNAKWIKVCGILPNLSPGGTASVTLSDSGSGNFGGADMATDNGPTITVNTGAAVFGIKKANFNVIDSVVTGGKTILASSSAATRGLVLTGPNPTAPFPGNVTCSPDPNGTACTTIYSSANDANSTCSIEESGPVMTVVRCLGTHKDASNNPYMQFTARMYFYAGKTSANISSVLRNANYDTSAIPSPDCNATGSQCSAGTFNTAFKGMKSYELRLAPSISGALSYTIAGENYTVGSAGGNQANPGTLLTGSLGGNDYATMFQGQSEWMNASTFDGEVCQTGSACAARYTGTTGYLATTSISGVVNTIASGNQNKVTGGWADIADSSGTGLEIGMMQFSAQWPASLEFQGGGADVRVGMFSAQNDKAFYMDWPQWWKHEMFVQFHATALTAPANDFLRAQHSLVARPTIAYTNSTKALEYAIADPAQEDALYVAAANEQNPNTLPQARFCFGSGGTFANSNCLPDRGVNDPTANGNAQGLWNTIRYYSWGAGGSGNQLDLRMGDVYRFLQRGQTGRLLNSKAFYDFMATIHLPMADGTTTSDHTVNGFTWRSRPPASAPVQELDSFGTPSGLENRATNYSLGFIIPEWREPAHDHWSGMLDYYFLTGDEFIKEAMVPNKDFYLQPVSYQYGSGGNLFSSRAWGTLLMNSARYSEYLASIADPDAAGVLAIGTYNFDHFVNQQTCEGGLVGGVLKYYPTGCTPPAVDNGANPIGISLERGNHQMDTRAGPGWCWLNAGSDNATGVSGGSQSNLTANYRFINPFQESVLAMGLITFRRVQGSSWANYNRALDLAYGLSRNAFTEAFADNGSAKWSDGTSPTAGNMTFYNGWRYGVMTDFANACPASTVNPAGNVTLNQNLSTIGGKVYDDNALPGGTQNLFFHFWVQSLVAGDTSWSRQLKITMQHAVSGSSIIPGEFGMFSIGNLISALNNPPVVKLQDIPFTVTDLGSGSYQLTFTPPAGTCTDDPGCLRIKWSPKQIRTTLGMSDNLLGFDPINTFAFTYSPDTYATWFGANNAEATGNVPAPTPGATQSVIVVTGTTGLSTAANSPNFSVKAKSPATSGSSGPPASLVSVSGNGQTGTIGQALASPFVVMVADAAGNPVSGVSVTFSVTAGGGSLTVTTGLSDSQGLVASTLTLGSVVGTSTVTATSGTLTGSPVTFTAAGVAGSGNPTNLVLVSGNGQSGSPSQPLANPFTAKVTDAGGNPVSGVTVTFAVTAGGGSLNPATVQTNTQGVASTTLTLGAAAGTNTVTAASGSLAGSPITFTATAVSAAASNLVMVSGNSQTGTVGQPLGASLVVKVTDAGGNAVSGVNVTFTVTAGGGSLNQGTVATNSQGTASANLTLGPATGANTVTATSLGLAGSPVTFALTGIASSQSNSSQGNVSWAKQPAPAGMPGWNAWLVLPYDPVSGQTMFWTNDSAGIYANRMRFYNAATNAFTAIAGTGSKGNACPGDVPNLPGDRHPVGQMAVDTKRNVLWIFGGVNQNCGGGFIDINGTSVTLTPDMSGWTYPMNGQLNGQQYQTQVGTFTIASVQDSTHLTLTTNAGQATHISAYIVSGSESNPRQDMYYLTLNSDPTQDKWQQVVPNHWPVANSQSGLVHDPDDDVLFVFGSDVGSNTHDNWVYCRTAENLTPGVLTAKQLAAGCVNPDDWNEITPAGRIQPPGNGNPGLVYDTVTKKVLQYGGNGCSPSCNQTWAYDVPTHTWTQKALNTTPPPPYNSEGVAEPAMAYNPTTHKVLLHQFSNNGAPADWQYDPVADTWTLLTSSGGGPAQVNPNSPNDGYTYLSYDVGANALITWSQTGGAPEVWKGSFSSGPVSPVSPASGAANLSLVSGNNQSGWTNRPLVNAFVVKVTDASGNPVPGVAVNFSVNAGGGALSLTAGTSNNQGLVTTTLTLGAGVGMNTVLATSGALAGSPITFSATSLLFGDLNGDNVVNAADVQIAINQALGIAPCTNGDLNNDAACNALDIQLVIGAALGGSSPPLATATFVKTDTSTSGSWKGAYGTDGYIVMGDTASTPAYATVTPSGNLSYTWAGSTSDSRALQKATSPTDRIAACWYNSTPFSIDLMLNDNAPHQVALYFLDWDDYLHRSERIDILDANNTLLDSRTVTSFVNGQYLVWNVSGHVTIRITNTNSLSNAVVNGVFFR